MHFFSVRAISRDSGIRLLRIGIAALLLIHGVYRAMNGGVAPFGEFLDASGIPFGFGVAIALTIVEIVGSLLLAAGIWIHPLVVWFSVELIAGMVMVHARNGWFVVGGGRNGVEYSVALILALVAIAVSEWRASRQPNLA